MLAERLNVDGAVIEAQLAHAVKDALGRACNGTEFLEQRRKTLQTWADYLDELRQGAEIIPSRASGIVSQVGYRQDHVPIDSVKARLRTPNAVDALKRTVNVASLLRPQ